MYPLPLSKATPVSNHQIESYRVVILTDCQGIGVVQYAHVAMVYEATGTRPIFAVASEVNRMAKLTGGGSHFLCTYDDKHNNYGSADDWADLQIFTEEALYLIKNHFVGSPDEKPQSPEIRLLHRRIQGYQDALQVIIPDSSPDKYGLKQFELGAAYSKLAARETEGTEIHLKAIEAYQVALLFISRAKNPAEYEDALIAIAKNYFNIGMIEFTPEAWLKARDAYQAAIAELTSTDVTKPAGADRGFALGRLYEELGDVFKMLEQMPDAIQQWKLAQQTYLDTKHEKIAEFVAKKIAQNQDQPPANPAAPPTIPKPEDARPTFPTFPSKSASKPPQAQAKPVMPPVPPGGKSLVSSIFEKAYNEAARLEQASRPASLSADQLKLLVNNSISVKTNSPSDLNDWRQKMTTTREAATTSTDKEFMAALLAVLDDRPASLPADNPYQTTLARVIGETAFFRLPPKKNQGVFGGLFTRGNSDNITISQDTFTRLFLEASDLPNDLKRTEVHRRETLQPRDLIFEKCGGLHSGLVVWQANMNNPLWRLVDIRWSFLNEDAAYAYHHMALTTNCEGQSGAVGVQPVGNEGFVFGGTSKDPLFGMEMTQFFYLFRVKQTVVKLYAAEGDRLPPGQRLTPDMLKPIAENIVSRIQSV